MYAATLTETYWPSVDPRVLLGVQDHVRESVRPKSLSLC